MVARLCDLLGGAKVGAQNYVVQVCRPQGRAWSYSCPSEDKISEVWTRPTPLLLPYSTCFKIKKQSWKKNLRDSTVEVSKRLEAKALVKPRHLWSQCQPVIWTTPGEKITEEKEIVTEHTLVKPDFPNVRVQIEVCVNQQKINQAMSRVVGERKTIDIILCSCFIVLWTFLSVWA